MPKNKIGVPTTNVIYIGNERYQFLAAQAREISYMSSTDIKATTFIQYLVDEFSEEARKRLLNDLSKRASK
jgi:ABC-type sulfate transport system substrate-binding protein